MCGGILLGLIGYIGRAFPVDGLFAVTACLVFCLLVLGVSAFAIRHLGSASFGRANCVTLLRATLATLLAGFLVAESSGELLWLSVVLASTALLLDGVDGWLARRFGEESHFGARFDMETDAALIMILAGLAWHFDRVGAWILLAGLMRYAFVLAGRLWPRLQRPLPPSRRRQTVCVVQVLMLLLCLMPPVPAWLAQATAAAGLVTLSVSFAIDVIRLGRAAGPPAFGRLAA